MCDADVDYDGADEEVSDDYVDDGGDVDGDVCKDINDSCCELVVDN